MRRRTPSYPSVKLSEYEGIFSRLHSEKYSPADVEVHNLGSKTPFIAKNYDGYRVVYTCPYGENKARFTMYTSRSGDSIIPSKENLQRFKRDVAEAGKTNPEVRTFLEKHPFPSFSED
ncbi:hypothetical protein JXA56_02500 [Candidatus Micrarchaeota archaeon]|nr:hypothetical protein [Candidatus Micrarchaeota archaeon]